MIQFKATGEAFLYDAASAHGTFLNKRRLKPRQHEPLRLAYARSTLAHCGCEPLDALLCQQHPASAARRMMLSRRHRVGDTFRLGQSTRLYVVGGPEQMMPEEGLSREQHKQLRVMQVTCAAVGGLRDCHTPPVRAAIGPGHLSLEPASHACSANLWQAKQARQDAEGRVGKAQMDAALAAGASWGFGEDAAEEIAEGEDIEWRPYAETHSLTDKQVLQMCLLSSDGC